MRGNLDKDVWTYVEENKWKKEEAKTEINGCFYGLLSLSLVRKSSKVRSILNQPFTVYHKYLRIKI